MDGLPGGASERLFEFVAAAALDEHRSAPLSDHGSHGIKRGTNLNLLSKVTLLEHAGADLMSLRTDDDEPVADAQRQRAAELAMVRGCLGAEFLHAANHVEPTISRIRDGGE